MICTNKNCLNLDKRIVHYHCLRCRDLKHHSFYRVIKHAIQCQPNNNFQKSRLISLPDNVNASSNGGRVLNDMTVAANVIEGELAGERDVTSVVEGASAESAFVSETNVLNVAEGVAGEGTGVSNDLGSGSGDDTNKTNILTKTYVKQCYGNSINGCSKHVHYHCSICIKYKHKSILRVTEHAILCKKL